jgi:uncharacterized protein (DUF488 family)
MEGLIAAQWPPGAIFTIGHSTLSIDRFVALLQAYGIERLVDIRTVRGSRRNPQFNEKALRTMLESEHIDYTPLQGLGGLRRPQKDSPNTGWRNAGFRGYADYMQSAEFEEALESLMLLGRTQRVAIMCAEALPWRCHRSLVADALHVRGVPVIEILSNTSFRTHSLTPFAQVTGTRIIYPPEQAELF